MKSQSWEYMSGPSFSGGEDHRLISLGFHSFKAVEQHKDTSVHSNTIVMPNDVVHCPQVWFTFSSSGKYCKSKHDYSQEGFTKVQTSTNYFLTTAGDFPNCLGSISFQIWWCFLLGLYETFFAGLEALTWLLCGYFPHRAAGAAVSSSPILKHWLVFRLPGAAAAVPAAVRPGQHHSHSLDWFCESAQYV